MTVQKNRRMVMIQVNNAEKHFLDKYVAAGKLPVFEKILQSGQWVNTHFPLSDEGTEKSSASISPWRIWSTINTGLKALKNPIVGFGQDPQNLGGHYIWDQLNAMGITTGILGSLVSTEIPKDPHSLFYVPGSRAAVEDCIPTNLKVIQKLLNLTSSHCPKLSFMNAIQLLLQLGLSIFKGLPISIVREAISQITMEFKKGIEYQQRRFLKRAKLQMEVFQVLYHRYKPDFSIFHLEYIAFAQQLYWRAAEPENYKDKLGELDDYFFGSLELRKTYENSFKDLILDSFILADLFLGKLLPTLDENTLLVIISGGGQKRKDPVDEIHKPKMYFHHFQELLQKVDIMHCEILTQMNPNITLNFKNATEASLAAFKLSNLKVLGEDPLFEVQQYGSQLFLQEILLPTIWFLAEDAWIENKLNEQIIPLFDYVNMSQLKEQHTAKDSGEGWMLCYGSRNPLPIDGTELNTEEVYPLLVDYFKEQPYVNE